MRAWRSLLPASPEGLPDDLQPAAVAKQIQTLVQVWSIGGGDED